jgi:uncharacterized protein with NRDE domain
MCLIIFGHEVHPEFRLLVAANRDEFHERPTAPAGLWPDAPEILAGRDLMSGGTWLGVTRSGRWAAVTNFRDGRDQRPDAISRGLLVADFLRGSTHPAAYVDSLLPRLNSFNGFNLLVGGPEGVAWLSNGVDSREGGDRPSLWLPPGVYGISNHLLDTPWPKVTKGKKALSTLLEADRSPSPDALLGLLMDRAYAADHDLPTTGVPLELERALSASFISTPAYGTRSSSALLVRRDGVIHFAERRFDAGGSTIGEDRFEIEPES